MVFDEWEPDRFKFVALDLTPGVTGVLVGHVAPGKSWVVDVSFAKALALNTDYVVVVIMKGTSVSVQLDGVFVGSFAFNAPVVGGRVGVLARSGTASFDSYRIVTNDPAFVTGGSALRAAGEGGAVLGTRASRLDERTLVEFVDEAQAMWAAELGLWSKDVRVALADLSGDLLGLTLDDTIYVDVDAAGSGWSTSTSVGSYDPLTVVAHERGHVLGLEHDDAGEFPVMAPTLVRSAPEPADREPAVATPSASTRRCCRSPSLPCRGPRTRAIGTFMHRLRAGWHPTPMRRNAGRQRALPRGGIPTMR